MKVVYLSDLHFEINGRGGIFHTNKFPAGNLLAIAGDTSPVKALQHNMQDSASRSVRKCWDWYRANVFPMYKNVIITFGNHEYYGSQYSESEAIIKEYFKNDNVYVAEKNHVIIDGILFIMTPLWTDFEGENPLSMMAAHGYMSDYRLIYESLVPYKKPITPEFILTEHKLQNMYLLDVLRTYPGMPTYVMTHHAPSYQSIHPKYRMSEANGAYYSNLEDLVLDHPQIKFWHHGHTHNSGEYMIGDTKVISNQCGYLGYDNFQGFDPDKFVEFH